MEINIDKEENQPDLWAPIPPISSASPCVDQLSVHSFNHSGGTKVKDLSHENGTTTTASRQKSSSGWDLLCPQGHTQKPTKVHVEVMVSLLSVEAARKPRASIIPSVYQLVLKTRSWWQVFLCAYLHMDKQVFAISPCQNFGATPEVLNDICHLYFLSILEKNSFSR